MLAALAVQIQMTKASATKISDLSHRIRCVHEGLGSAIASANEPREAWKSVLAALLSVSKASEAAYFGVTDGGISELLWWTNGPLTCDSAQFRTLSDLRGSRITEFARSIPSVDSPLGETTLHIQRDPFAQPQRAGHDERAHWFHVINLPLSSFGAVVGSLTLIRPASSGCFSSGEISDIKSLTGMVALLAERTRRPAGPWQERQIVQSLLEDRTQTVEQDLAALQRFGDQLAGHDDLADLLHAVLRETSSATGAVIAGVFLYDPVEHVLQMTAAVAGSDVVDLEHDPAYAFWKSPVPVESARVWRRIAAGEVLWCDNEIATPEHRPEAIVWHRGRGHRMLVSTVMKVGNEVYGYLGLGFTDPTPQYPHQIALCQAFAQQAALAVRVTRLAQQSERAAVLIERQRAAQILRQNELARSVEAAADVTQRAAELASTNRLLMEYAARLAEGADFAASLRSLLADAIELTKAATAAIFFASEGNASLRLEAMLLRSELIDVQRDPSVAIWHHSSPYQVGIAESDDPSHWPAAADDLQAVTLWHQAHGHGYTPVLNLKFGDEIVGLLALAFDQADRLPPTSAKLELCRLLAQQTITTLRLMQSANSARLAAVQIEKERAASLQEAELAAANLALRGMLGQLTQSSDPSDFVRLAAMEVAKQANATSAYVFRYDEATDQLKVVGAVYDGEYFVGGRDDDPIEFRKGFPAKITSAFEELSTTRTLLLTQTETQLYAEIWPFTVPWHKRRGHKSRTAVALLAGKKPVGLLGLGFTEHLVLTPVQSQLLIGLSQQISLALEMANLAEKSKQAALDVERQQQSLDRARALSRANEALRQSAIKLSRSTNLDEVGEIFAMEALHSSNACACALFLERDRGFRMVHLVQDEVILREEAVQSLECTKAVYAASLAGTPHFAALREGTPIWRHVDQPGTAWVTELLQYHRSHGHRSIWDIPFSADSKVVGYVALAFRDDSAPVALTSETIGALANQVSLALSMTTLAARLRSSGIREAVTVERTRMAREIHDNLAQSFTSIGMQVDVLLSRADTGGSVGETLRVVLDTARHGATAAKSTALALMPMEHKAEALGEALADLARRSTLEGKVACTFRSIGSPELLSPDVQEALLKIAQEAVINALKHSGGNEIIITLSFVHGSVTLVIADNGSGLEVDPSRGGMGLGGMKLRAGQVGAQFKTVTAASGGTLVEVSMPINWSSSNDS